MVLRSIDITPTNPSIAKGTTQQLIATGTYSNASTQDLTDQVTWVSSDDTAAMVSDAAGSKGLATGVDVGTAMISTTLEGVSGATMLTVTGATLVSIDVTPINPSIAKGTTAPFAATGIFSDGTNQDLTTQVTWASSDGAVAGISNAAGDNGLADGVDTGSTTLSATLAGVSGTTALTVTAATLVSLEVTPTAPSIAKGTAQQLTATGIYTDVSTQDLTAQVVWASSDKLVATISNAAGTNGLASGAGVGDATITATLGGVSGTTALAVTPAVLVSMDVTPTNPSLAKGTTQPLVATGIFSDRTDQDLTTQVAWASSDGTVATVSNAAGSNGLASGVEVGSATITATFSGVSGTTVLTVTPATLVSLEVTPTNAAIAKGTAQAFIATGIYTDFSTQDLTGEVTWSSSDGAVAAISNATGSNGLATGEGVGSATVTATLAGVSGATPFTITPATVVALEVTPTSPSIAKGTTQQLVATGIYTDSTTQDLTGQATWASSDETVAAISNAAGSHGLATGVGTGNATLSATLAGVSGATLLTITPATLVALEVTPTSPSIAKGTTQPFVATGIYTDASRQDHTADATWTSSNEGAAAISNAAGSKGLATGVGVGNTTITATLAGVSGATALAITPATLVSIDVTPSDSSIALGTTQQFTATGTYTDATTQDLTTLVTWISSDETVAAISNADGSKGLASGVAVGNGTSTATLGGVSGTTAFAITPATLVLIGVTPTNPAFAKGTTQQLTATGIYTDFSVQDLTAEVTWGSFDGAVASVSNAAGSNGLATAVGVGSTTVTATLAGVSGTTRLTVGNPLLVSIEVSPADPSIAKGTTLQFAATGVFSDSTKQDLTAQTTWASSSATVAAISNAAGSNGLATGTGVGSTTISATLAGVSGTTTLTVTAATLVSIEVTPFDPSIAKGTTQIFAATGTYTDASTQDLTDQVAWASSDGAVAGVSNVGGSNGLATGSGVGSATITATLAGVSGTTTLTVTAATLVSIAVTPADPSVANGTAKQFTATGTYTDATTQDLTTQVTWLSSDVAVVAISNAAGSKGLATGVGVGVATITARLAGVSGMTTLTVTSATLVSITVTPPNATLPVGFSRPLTATGNYSDASTVDLTTRVVWSSSVTGKATISNAAGSEGLATGVGVGVTTISATFAGISGSTGLMVTNETLTSIAVTPSPLTLMVGETQQMTATGTFSGGTVIEVTFQVRWSSNDKGVASVGNTKSRGLVTARSPGSATIKASKGNKNGTATVTVQ